MPVFSAKLSEIDELIKELKAYKAKVEAAPRKIVEELAEVGRSEIQGNLGAITDVDGNHIAGSGKEVNGNKAVAFMNGSQASFLEFGTGIQGQSSPHPDANKHGWEYNTGATIVNNRWRYYDPFLNQFVVTSGIPAQMPVLRAANEVRSQASKVAKEALK